MKSQSKSTSFVNTRKKLKNMLDEKTKEQLQILDEKSKRVLDICDIKHELVATMLKKDTCNKISQEEIDRFNNYLNVIVKSNKSSNNLNNRISSIYELVKNHYKDYQKLNSIMVSNNNN